MYFKTIASVLFLIISFNILSRAQSGDKFALSRAALEIIDSEFATKRFPTKKLKISPAKKIKNPIIVQDNRLYNICKLARNKKGILPTKYLSSFWKVITADIHIDQEEKMILHAIMHNKKVDIQFDGNQQSRPSFSVTFDTPTETKNLIEKLLDKDIEISSRNHISSQFEKSKKIDNWLEYYYGNEKEKELALAFFDYRVSNLGYKDFILSWKSLFWDRDKKKYPNATFNEIFRERLIEYHKRDILYIGYELKKSLKISDKDLKK